MWALYELTYDTRCGEGEHGSSEKKSYKRKSWISCSRSNWANEDILTPATIFMAQESSNCWHSSVHERVLTWNTRIVQAIVYCRLAHVWISLIRVPRRWDGTEIIDHRLHLRRQQGWSVRRTLSFLSFFQTDSGFSKISKNEKFFINLEFFSLFVLMSF